MNGRFITKPSEEIVEEVAKWFGFLDNDSLRFEADEIHHFVSKAYNVLLVEGIGTSKRRMEQALEEAKSMAETTAPSFDFQSADKCLIQFCVSKSKPLLMEEMESVQIFLSTLPPYIDVAWGISYQEQDERVRIRMAVANLKRK